MNGVEFRRTGTHCFDVFFDERFSERVSLEVTLARPADATTA
jgi:hypothetical protein